MTAVWQRHPLATVLGLEIGAIALTVVGALALSTLWPGLPESCGPRVNGVVSR